MKQRQIKSQGEHRRKKKPRKDHNRNFTFRTLISYGRGCPKGDEFRRWRKMQRRSLEPAIWMKLSMFESQTPRSC